MINIQDICYTFKNPTNIWQERLEEGKKGHTKNPKRETMIIKTEPI